MNKRIMVLLLVLVAVLFINVAPIEANAAADPHTCVDDNRNCVCDVTGCTNAMHIPNQQWTSDENGHYQWCLNDCATKLLQAGHTYGSFVNQGAQQHWRDCTVCSYTDKQSHSDATKDCVCEGCGAKLEHDTETIHGFEATCEKDGLHTHLKCKNCGVRIHIVEGRVLNPNEEIIKALGHVENGQWSFDDNQHYQWCWRDCATKLKLENHTFTYVNQGRDQHDVKCATCGYSVRAAHRDGNNSDCFCDDCGAELQHNLTTVNAVPVSCVKDGIEAHQKCGYCGKLFDMTGKQISAIPTVKARGYHEMGRTLYNDVREGNHYSLCVACGYNNHEQHKMVLDDPMKGNYHQWLCDCGELKIETHYDKGGDKICDVCGHKMGKTSVTVQQHDNTTVKTGDKDTVKPNKNWWQNWQESMKPSNFGGSSTTEQTSTDNAPAVKSGSNANVNTNNQPSSDNGGAQVNPSNNEVQTPSGNNGTQVESGNGGSQVTPDNTVTAPGNNVTAPSAAQTNVLVQFVSWFLGLFGF